MLVACLAGSGIRFLPGGKALQGSDDQARAEHEPLVLLPFVTTQLYRLRLKRAPSFDPRNRLLLLSLFLHAQSAGPFGRTFAVPIQLAVVAVSLVRAAIVQLYSTALAYLVESFLRRIGSLNTQAKNCTDAGAATLDTT